MELMVQALAHKLDFENKEDAAQASRISDHLREAIRQTKSLARGLSPVELQANGLMSALQELAVNVREIFRANVSFEARTPVLLEDNARATHLFRIAQEALSNAVKHGGATDVRIEIERTPTEIILSVVDNGHGFSPGQSSGGMGLRIMEYRSSMIGGEVTVQTAPDYGTKVICTAPVSR
jgi:two-component system CheB/CheR fusion protein